MYKIASKSSTFKKQDEVFQYTMSVASVEFSKEQYPKKKDIAKWYLNGGFKSISIALDLQSDDVYFQDSDSHYIQAKQIYKEPLCTSTYKINDLGITLHYHLTKFKLTKQEDISKLEEKVKALND